jgi:hypothetical protein
MPLPVRVVEINGGTVKPAEGAESWRLSLPPTRRGYADAQIDDYGGRTRKLSLAAGHATESGSALLARRRGSSRHGWLWLLERAIWTRDRTITSVAASSVVLLRLAAERLTPCSGGGKRQWLVCEHNRCRNGARIGLGTARTSRPAGESVSAVAAQPGLASPTAFAGDQLLPAGVALEEWHRYELEWRAGGCSFRVDGELVLETPHSPRGPLGFVAWIDNQYLVATATGRFHWGTEATNKTQVLELRELQLEQY